VMVAVRYLTNFLDWDRGFCWSGIYQDFLIDTTEGNLEECI
jgi:hypothetical protein